MNNELFSRLKDLAQKENRARLAVLLGAAAMLLILLSELFAPSEKTAAASAAPADDNVYRQQLERRLSVKAGIRLIAGQTQFFRNIFAQITLVLYHQKPHELSSFVFSYLYYTRQR